MWFEILIREVGTPGWVSLDAHQDRGHVNRICRSLERRGDVECKVRERTHPPHLQNRLPGGKGDHLRPRSVSAHQLVMGIAVEREHTRDPDLAREIALDHLAEDSRYYTKLRRAKL